MIKYNKQKRAKTSVHDGRLDLKQQFESGVYVKVTLKSNSLANKC